jgi:MFS family permease
MSGTERTMNGETGAEKPSGYACYALGVLFLVYLVNFIDRQMITILAPDIKRDLGLDDADIGFLYGTAFAVFYALFGIPLGRLADSWHRVRLLTIGLAVWSAMTAISGLARGGAALAGARIGVGIGEATASPAAYSLISDMFPRDMRATALAIYSAGAYLGGGLSLMIGGYIVEAWDHAYPDGGAVGLAGWQVAFMAVGLPGLLLALWVATLREPVRGGMDGMPVPASAAPFRGFVDELFAAIPPFTLVAAARRGGRAFAVNLGAALLVAAAAWALIALTGAILQWTCVGIGYYAVFSWASALRRSDPATFTLIWKSRAFLATILGYGVIAFLTYGTAAFAPVYALEVLGGDAKTVGFWIGGGSAVAGFLGVILGGRLSDRLHRRNPAGRIAVLAIALVAPVVPVVLAFGLSDGPPDFTWFSFWIAIANFLFSLALGAAAATSQDLVLPRMRGTATAALLLATTLIGLALGPYTVGELSASTGHLGLAVMSIFAVVPLGLGLLHQAWRHVPCAASDIVERARGAGEAI